MAPQGAVFAPQEEIMGTNESDESTLFTFMVLVPSHSIDYEWTVDCCFSSVVGQLLFLIVAAQLSSYLLEH
jgi:hypothetical protein